MSRVERKEEPDQIQRREANDNSRRQPVDRTPSKAEGEESTVDQALENQEERRS